MLSCPHCEDAIDLRTLRHQGLFTSHRICPTCEAAFDVDPQTKKRQAAFILLAIISLILTIFMYFDFRQWAPFAIPSYLILGVLIYFANRKVYLVRYEPTKSESGHD
jgi:hypothetical protein